MKTRLFSFLAMLLIAVSGVYATDKTATCAVTVTAGAATPTPTLLTTITPDASGNPTYSVAGMATLATNGCPYDATQGWYDEENEYTLQVTPADGVTVTTVKFITSGDESWEVTEAPFQAMVEYGFAVYTKMDAWYTGGLKTIEVYGYATPPTATQYTISLDDGTEDADNWTISPATAEEGESVTIQYNGTKKVKSVTAVKTSAPAASVAVDLGLSVKWANMNLGAEKESDYGDYFAWGESEPYYSSIGDPMTWKEGKSAGYASSGWGSYQFHDGSSFTKYNGSDKSTLDPEDDAVAQIWGGGWRMPTKAELEELFKTSPYYSGDDKINGYTWTWYDGTNNKYNDYGTAGWAVVNNANHAAIFLPAAGECYNTSLRYQGSQGLYWSSSLAESDTQRAWSLNFTASSVETDDDGRFRGYTIRPVKSKR